VVELVIEKKGTGVIEEDPTFIDIALAEEISGWSFSPPQCDHISASW